MLIGILAKSFMTASRTDTARPDRARRRKPTHWYWWRT